MENNKEFLFKDKKPNKPGKSDDTKKPAVAPKPAAPAKGPQKPGNEPGKKGK